MDGEVALNTLAGIMKNVTSLVGGLTGMFSSLTTATFWFVFLPITFVVFSFIFGKFKSVLMFRKGRKRH